MYFSSKGHDGYGGYDLFLSNFENGKWSTPENMGKPFNSPGHDIYLSMNILGTHGYFSSSRAGGYGDMDIYEIGYERKSFENFKPDSLQRISIKTADTAYLNETIMFSPKETKIPLNQFKEFTWAVDDSVLVPNANKEVSFTFRKLGSHTVKLEAIDVNDVVIDYQKIMSIIQKPAQLATNTFGLEPVYFEFNKSGINEVATQAVERNIKTLNEHPDAIIEISAYCDARGSAIYNQALSERRAKAVIKYLKQKGFDTKRVKQVDWFGEKDPVNKCTDAVPCTEDEYKLNRRAEFRLVK